MHIFQSAKSVTDSEVDYSVVTHRLYDKKGLLSHNNIHSSVYYIIIHVHVHYSQEWMINITILPATGQYNVMYMY